MIQGKRSLSFIHCPARSWNKISPYISHTHTLKQAAATTTVTTTTSETKTIQQHTIVTKTYFTQKTSWNLVTFPQPNHPDRLSKPLVPGPSLLPSFTFYLLVYHIALSISHPRLSLRIDTVALRHSLQHRQRCYHYHALYHLDQTRPTA